MQQKKSLFYKKIIFSLFILMITSFSILAIPTNIKFSFAVISDTPDGDCENPTIPTTTQGEALIQSVDFLNSKNPAFIIGVGDLISGQCKSLPGSARDQLNEFKTQFLDKINAPFVPVVGNHDFLNAPSKTAWKTFLNENQDKFLDTYNSRTICDQQTSRFEYKGLGFVLIDPYNLGHKYQLFNAELSCIDQLVSSGDIVFRHVTPYGVSCRQKNPSNCGTSVLGDSGDVKDIEQLPQKLKQKNVKAIFSGHTHAFYHGMCDGLEFINTGTLGSRAEEFVKGWKPTDSTSTFAWVDVYDDDSIKTTFYLYNPSSKTFTPQTKQFPATVTSERISNPEKNDNEGVNAICTSIQPSASSSTSTSALDEFPDSDTPHEELVLIEQLILKEQTTITPGQKQASSTSSLPQKNILTNIVCLNQQSCREKDEVWVKIRNYVTLDPESSTKIFDPTTNQWKKFEELYPPPPKSELTSESTDLSSIPSEACLQEVKKLELAAKDMAKWVDQNDQCILTEYYKGNQPQSINLPYTCGYGFPSIDGLKALCPNPKGCCGTYTWNVYNQAIKKYGLNVKWPIQAYGSVLDHGPQNVKSGYLKIKLSSWGKDGDYNNANFKLNQLMPGDMVYYIMKKGMYGKCPTVGTSHINIVGLPRDNTNTVFNIIDTACQKQGICKTSFPDFFKKNYCTNQGTNPMTAGESWVYVYRVIPACIAATPPEIRAKFTKVGLQ